jgi:secreted PhoX family phosphatase
MRKSLIRFVTLGLALLATACGSSSSSTPPPPTEPTVWVANSNDTLTAYHENAGPDAVPLVTLANPYAQQFLAPPEQAALDSGGNLWVANAGGNNVIQISAAALGTSGILKPNLTIANPSGKNYVIDPHGVAIDAEGDLWVANGGIDTIVEYTAQQLTSNPNPQPFTFPPAVTISNPSGSLVLDEPEAMTFDAEGDLWVSNGDNDTIIEYTKSQLASSGSPAPAVIISSPSNVEYLDEPHGLAFDKNGGLWVANSEPDDCYINCTVPPPEVVGYTASQIASSGSPVPNTALVNPTSGNPIFDVPQFVAFDKDGDLWISNGNDGVFSPAIIEIAAADLTAGLFSPTPEVALTGPAGGIPYLYSASCLVFDSSENLIVTNEGRAYPVIKYSAASIEMSGGPEPEVALNNPSTVMPAIDRPVSLTVDSKQDLWAANDPHVEPGSVVEFGAGSIVNNTNNVVATLTISDPTGKTLDHPQDIRFDHSGNLWVANAYHVEQDGLGYVASNLVSYSASSIAAGKPTQTIVISNGDTLDIHRIHPDSEGDMWIAGDAFTIDAEYPTYEPFVAEYTASQLASSGTPEPAIILPGGDYFHYPTGLGFDLAGDLWVFSDHPYGNLGDALGVAYEGKNLSSSSAPVAAISGPGHSVQHAKFDAEGDLLVLEGDHVYEYDAAHVAEVDDGGKIPDAEGVISGPLSGLDFPRALAIDNAE